MKPSILVATLLTPAFAASAYAARPASWLEGDQTLKVAAGVPARLARNVREEPSREAARAFQDFRTAYGDKWKAIFDADTGVAVRVMGSGIAVPGSVMSPKAAEDAARAVLDQHRALLAPGGADFLLESNAVSYGMRTVAFTQYRDGLRVLGGQVSFRFKNDRLFVIGSEAFPNVEVEAGKTIAAAAAERSATRWIASDYRSTLKVKSVAGPMIFPLVRRSGAVEYHRALEVKLDAKAPIAAWTVYVDAKSGAPIARKQTLMFADGTLLMNAPERWPGSNRIDYAGLLAEVNVDGTNTAADVNGVFSWMPDQPAMIVARARGDLVSVLNDSGAEATDSFTLDPGASYLWDASGSEFVDAQITTYIHAHRAKERARLIAPQQPWFGEQLIANVNIGDVCNAFSDGETINFFIAGRGCENTGRLPDVIHHEFGHAIHAHAIIRGAGDFDTALSEGGSDYFAATITNDHGMGRGFFGDNQPLRDVDPANTEHVWPDDIAGDPHETGLIYAGAMWDLRKALINALGETQGIEHTDALWYQVFERASDIPTSYAEVVAADDDDGDLSNGTPNICDIDDAFAAHGLAMASAANPGVALPRANGLTITLPVTANAACPGRNVERAEISWQLRSSQQVNGTIEMVDVGGGLEAVLPAPPATNEVIQYRVDVTLGNGDALAFPDNIADPLYEVYYGEVTEIFCTDFEADPTNAGWTHTLEAGMASQGADDWQWGAPAGTQGSGDPDQAYSGANVFGNDLGGGDYNGRYQANKRNALHSPNIDIQGFSIVRLQYRRWLNIEDGFYDQARIIANTTEVWNNAVSNQNGELPHNDKEWRFHDVDLSAAIADGRVQVHFELESDGGLEMGGWTIDDFCIVGVGNINVAKCGDGTVNAGEACDDGNTADGDGCSATCTVEEVMMPRCGDGVLDAGEACDDGNLDGGDGCSAMCGIESPNGPVCGNGVIEAGEACEAPFDGVACAAGCVLPGPTSPTTLEESDSGCGCTLAEEKKHQELLGSLILLAVLGLSFVVRKRDAS